jgi:hypothetical protein
MTATWSWARMWQQIEAAEERALAEERFEVVCTCGLEGPDDMGNYDLIPDPKCPVHEGGPDA